MVTIWSQVRDFANSDSDEFSKAAGSPGVFYVWDYMLRRI